jgi:tetratricopeptide (TPR) repeat protein
MKSATIITSGFKLVNEFFLKRRQIFSTQATVRTAVVTSLVLMVGAGWQAETAFAKKKTTKVAADSDDSSRAAPVSAADANRKALDFGRSKFALPQSTKIATPPPTIRDIHLVKPPRSSEFYEGNSKEVRYEKLLDEEIRELYRLSQQYRQSRSRGEIWLRLAERYVEKAHFIEFREQAEYDKKFKDYLDKKTHVKPKLALQLSHDYNKKAVELYQWFIKDFKDDPKVDQALFFLGYNEFELGNSKAGEGFYQRLVQQYPDSAYVIESYFALGEYYFDNEKWQAALDSYEKVIRVKKARLNAFALYKSSWCLYRLSRASEALKMLERVIRISGGPDEGANVEGGKTVNRLRLSQEALRDYVPFYAEVGDPKAALSEFMRITQDETKAYKMLERLAYIYGDSGNKVSSAELFRQLIAKNPTAEKAADYQYQIILAYATSDQKVFRQEIINWLENFGPESAWAKENAKNTKLLADTEKLQETTLRNHVLQLHQTAQNSRTQFSQQAANSGYNLYAKYFSNSPKGVEMYFFHAELLFDMARYEEASRYYTFVSDKGAAGNSYYEKAIINNLLALEKALPSPRDIEAKRGKSLEPIPFDPPVASFEKGAIKYIGAFPKGDKVVDVQRRLGVLYYSYNQFDKAIEIFEKILREHPNSPNAEIAGNLLLDIYKLRGDMAGLSQKGAELLANPAIAKTKFGDEVRNLMEKASYVKADKLAASKDYMKSAKEYEKFADSYKKSDLAVLARYKAADNYEKAGDVASATRMHAFILALPSGDAKVKAIQNDSRNASARLYSQTGQLEQAAKQYASFARDNSKDQKGVNAYFNAAVLYDALGDKSEALTNYQAYEKQSKRADKIETVYLQAEIYRKDGQLRKAVPLYEQYMASGPNGEHVVKSSFEIALYHAQEGHVTKTKEAYQKTIDIQKHLKKSGKDVGVSYAAESKFQLCHDTVNEIQQLKFTSNAKQQERVGKQLQALREKYIGQMKDVIHYDHAPMIVAALASTGQMFEMMAGIFARIPVPADYTPEDAKKLKDLIQTQVNGLKTEAKNSYKAAFDKSIETETYGQWAKVARDGLAQYDTNVGSTGEEIPDAALGDWMGL